MAASGFRLLKELVQAFGLEGQPIRRLVIDVHVNDAVLVYFERYHQVDEQKATLAALERAVASECPPLVGEVSGLEVTHDKVAFREFL